MQNNDAKMYKKDYHLHLKQKMIENGLNIDGLAKKSGLSYEWIRQVMKGPDGRASNDAICKVCTTLNVDIKTIMRDIFKEEKEQQDGTDYV